MQVSDFRSMGSDAKGNTVNLIWPLFSLPQCSAFSSTRHLPHIHLARLNPYRSRTKKKKENTTESMISAGFLQRAYAVQRIQPWRKEWVSRPAKRGVTQVGGAIASSSLLGSARVLRQKRACISSGRAPPRFLSSFTTLPTSEPKKRMSSTFIVTFKNGTPDDVIEQHIQKSEASGAIIKHRYNAGIKGYSVEIPDNTVSALSFDHPDIDAVEADGEVTTQGQSLLG